MGSRHIVAAAVAVALLAGGCGSSDSSSSASGPRSWTLQQIQQDTGLKRSADGLSYSLPGHPRCVARIVLRSTAEVQTYKNAGDPIATNPDKSAGVRVEPEVPPACKAVFTAALAKVK
jgi:ABC-type phosphate/phosphonate transport system substrate-binding protein